MTQFTLKGLAEGAYVMGLSTIGEMAEYVRCHPYAYFLIDDFTAQIAAFDDLIRGHEQDPITVYFSHEDQQRIDAELESYFSRRQTSDRDSPDDDAGSSAD